MENVETMVVMEADKNSGQKNKQVLGEGDYERWWANLVLRELIKIFAT